MAKGDRYVKVVERSDQDKCFVGTRPQLTYGEAAETVKSRCRSLAYQNNSGETLNV